MKIVWTPAAADRLARLADFLVQHPDAARSALLRITKQINQLADNPRIGRPVPELVAEEREYREMLIPFGSAGYLVLYQIAGDQVVILNCKHQKEAGWRD